jgi:hypothetical protein
MKFLVILSILAFSCSPVKESSMAVDYSQHDDIIAKDLSNKQQELDILREIFRAQQNKDEDAFRFFLDEYMGIKRLVLTEVQKQHPEYKAWLTDEEIKSGAFMAATYNYIPSGE